MTLGGSIAHMKAMKKVMKYCLLTKWRGFFFAPIQKRNRDPEFELDCWSDSDFAKDPDRRKSVSGTSTFLCGASKNEKSAIQKIMALSVTEAELIASTSKAQESMELKVKLPMTLESENKGTG